MNTWRTRFVVAAALILACVPATARPADPEGPASAEIRRLAQEDQADRAGESAPICNGEPSVRLAFRMAGAGQTLPGSQVMTENGARFIALPTGTVS